MCGAALCAASPAWLWWLLLLLGGWWLLVGWLLPMGRVFFWWLLVGCAVLGVPGGVVLVGVNRLGSQTKGVKH